MIERSLVCGSQSPSGFLFSSCKVQSREEAERGRGTQRNSPQMLSLEIKACGFGTGLISFACESGSGSANSSKEGLEKKSTAFAGAAGGGARTGALAAGGGMEEYVGFGFWMEEERLKVGRSSSS